MMHLNKEYWSKKDYTTFIKELKSQANIKYKEFHKSLLNDDIKLIGIRTPILQAIAKEISKGNYIDFIKQNKHNYYEEIIIHGLIIGNLKLSFSEIKILINEFLPFNVNWATNDIVSAKLKIFKKEQKSGFMYIKKLLLNENSFTKRMAVVLLLDHYINTQYIDKILNMVQNLNDDNYYVKMGIAWLISICYIKFPDKTINILKNKKLNGWIHNMSINKIIESKRINESEKLILKSIKIKEL